MRAAAKTEKKKKSPASVRERSLIEWRSPADHAIAKATGTRRLRHVARDAADGTPATVLAAQHVSTYDVALSHARIFDTRNDARLQASQASTEC